MSGPVLLVVVGPTASGKTEFAVRLCEALKGEIVTADSVNMGPGLPSVSFDELQKLAADPKATAEFYKPWTKTVVGAASPSGMQPIASESQ